MNINTMTKILALSLSVLWVAGCSTTGGGTGASDTTTSGADTEVGTSTDTSVSGTETSSAEEDAKAALEALIAVKTVYFDFDKSSIKPEARAILDKHVEYLLANSDAVVTLEGHCDERGTREYNLALGERRAKAAYRYMTVKGVKASQLDTVSYGEERPIAFGQSESAYSKNRRVELK